MTVTSGIITAEAAKGGGAAADAWRWARAHAAAALAELAATALLMFLGCMSCVPLAGFDPQPPLVGAVGFGFAVLVNILAFGHVSGAHMNPSVTLASLVLGLTPAPLAAVYFVAQCAGATLGYYLLASVAPTDVAAEGVCATLPAEGLSSGKAVAVELLLTAALVLVCCGVWDPANARWQDSVAVKFGLVIVGLSVAGGPLTAAALNPARSLGPALLTGRWRQHWVYWAGPLTGSLLASLLYKHVWMKRPEGG